MSGSRDQIEWKNTANGRLVNIKLKNANKRTVKGLPPAALVPGPNGSSCRV
jgi:hypothetical protein